MVDDGEWMVMGLWMMVMGWLLGGEWMENDGEWMVMGTVIRMGW